MMSKSMCICVSCSGEIDSTGFKLSKVILTSTIKKILFWKKTKTVLVCSRCFDEFIDIGYRTGLRD